METPRQKHHPDPDPAEVQANALKLVKRAARKLSKAEAERNATIRYARESGASLREIAKVADVSHGTVSAICEPKHAAQG